MVEAMQKERKEPNNKQINQKEEIKNKAMLGWMMDFMNE